jgi:hypothetical protein
LRSCWTVRGAGPPYNRHGKYQSPGRGADARD